MEIHLRTVVVDCEDGRRVSSKDQNEERQRITMAANPLHNKQWYLLLLSAVTDN